MDVKNSISHRSNSKILLPNLPINGKESLERYSQSFSTKAYEVIIQSIKYNSKISCKGVNHTKTVYYACMCIHILYISLKKQKSTLIIVTYVSKIKHLTYEM